jgi:glutamyl-tRNA synthetase
MHDLIRGDVTVYSNTLDDKVLFKSDGMPTYHLANIVDDHLMEISHVIRGEEWLPSMPLHILLYDAFEWKAPQFAHLPLLLRPDGNGKLSKRDGDRLGFPVFPLEWNDPKTGEKSHGYREDGYFPEAVVNMLALLGWNPGTEQELFTMEELINAFSIERVGKSGSKFDVEKAKWFNQQYLRLRSNDELAALFMPVLKQQGIENISEKYLASVIGLIKDRADFVHDFWEQGWFFFQPPQQYDEQVVKKRWDENMPLIISQLSQKIEAISDWNATTIKETIMQFITENGLNTGQIMNCLRLLMVGASIGPDLTEMMEVLGREETLKRVLTGIHKIVQ